jgi:PAS domain S-box-containing protein
MVGRIKEQTTIVDLIASGNLNVEVNIKSEKDILGKGLSIVTETLKKLINETIILTKAASEGKLSVRGNSEKFKGRYREIIEGINNTLDAVIGPLYLAAEYIERIGKHEIPNKITDIYKGDFKEISDNLNSCIDNVTSYRSAIERREQELKNALIESEQSKEYSEKIVDTANVMIICLDINGNIQVFNKDAENITGYRKDEVLNKNWFELIIPRQIYPEMMDLFSKWIREGSEEFLMNYENSIITKSGEKRYIEWQNSLLKEGDKIIGTISFGIDITEKKLAELEREVNYRISQAINTTENLEELLSVIHQNLKKIIYAENCYIALFDTETRLVSFPLFIDKFDSRPLPRIKSKGLTEYVLKTGKPLLISPDNLENLLTNNEVELIGSPPASWLGVPLIVHTETIGVLTVQSYDVNIKYSERDKNLLVNIGNQASFAIERKLAEKARIRLEKQLFRSQKMESLGRLAGGIAHDFNNVLTAIMGNADMLYNESDKQKSSRHALQIKKASQRGADLAKQLLAFAKMETYKIAPVSVNELLEETVKLLEHTFQKSIEIKLHNEKDLPLIDGDKSPLQQVFLNLCVNARDAMPDGGTLTFKTQIIFVDENLFEKPNELPPGNYVFISISDTGHGMSEEILQHIYDPFFTTKGEGKGTGLGLSIAYGIIKSHKGFITVDSQVNSGTTFKIYFPVSAMDVKQKTEENKVKQIIFGEGETILLVDDDEMVLEVNKDILVNINYKVITCSNGFDAIEIYKNRINEIDLIILDCAMPKMTGEETLKRLKEINPYVKVLMASGLINEPDVYKRIKEFDDCDFLYKPYNVEQLADAVNTTLRKKI